MIGDGSQPLFEGQFDGFVGRFFILVGVVAVIGLLWNQWSDGDGSVAPIQLALSETFAAAVPRLPSVAAAAATRDPASRRQSEMIQSRRWSALERAAAVERAVALQYAEVFRDQQLVRFEQLERVDDQLSEMFTETILLLEGVDERLRMLEVLHEESPWCWSGPLERQ